MDKINIFFLTAMIIIASKVYPDIQSGLNDLRISYRDGKYISILKNGSEIIKAACGEIIKDFYGILPDLRNYAVSNIRSSYNFDEGDGLTDYSITVEKTFTGIDETVVMTISVSPFDVARYDNLIKGYDYLTDKGDYEKYSIFVRKTEYSYIIDRATAYFALIIEKNNNSGEVTSGLLFKINFTKGVKSGEKKALIEECLKALINRLLDSNLIGLLK